MNRIEANLVRSEFVPEPHLAILIDGEPLDRLLDSFCSGLLGLIPAWLDWMYDAAEQRVAHDRMRLPSDGHIIAPVLICPDDLDFSCTTVVAEVRATETFVEWTRLGLNRTESSDPEEIGGDVGWLEGVGPMRFPRAEYESCVDAFRNAVTDE